MLNFKAKTWKEYFWTQHDVYFQFDIRFDDNSQTISHNPGWLAIVEIETEKMNGKYN